MGTQLYRDETSPRFFLGHGFAMGYLCANIVVISTLWLVLKKVNEKREASGGHDISSGFSDEEDFRGDEDPRWRFYL